MLAKEDLVELIQDIESSRAERTVSVNDTDKFCEAVCAFANDMPDSKQNGYLLVGVHDDGRLSGLEATDSLLKNLAAIRSDGNVLPIPVMNVETFHLPEGDVVVVEVAPAVLPPVRYRGRTWIRVGPRRAIATPEEVDLLIERRRVKFPTFDSMPCPQARLDDLDLELFKHGFLPKAFDEGTLASETRTIERQLEALCFYSTEYGCPTNAGVILFGKNPLRFLPGDYIQFVQFAGKDRASDIVNQQMFRGCLLNVLPEVDTFVKTAIAKNRPVPVTILRERTVYDYPKWPIRELMMNAIMHRDYRSTGPTMFYQYADRIELLNSGGLYGRVNRENFPDENDYRNPIIADAMRTLGYVNRFGRGIGLVKVELVDNGNGEPSFDTAQIGSFRVSVGLTKYALMAGDATLPVESSQRLAESAESRNQTKERMGKSEAISGESVPASSESTPRGLESTPRGQESSPRGQDSVPSELESSPSREQIAAWAQAVLPDGIRSDGLRNMIKVLVIVGQNKFATTDSIASEIGITQRGVKKITAALQKLGFLRHDGPAFGGHWELVGFEP